MIERSAHRTRPVKPTFPDVVAALYADKPLRIEERSAFMAFDGYERSIHSRDPAHDDRHLDGIGNDAFEFYRRYGHKTRIDWNALLPVVGYHDAAVGALPPNPLSLFVAQNWEHLIAVKPAGEYMRVHAFPDDLAKRISLLIQTHPLSLNDPRRIRLEKPMDDTFRRTSMLFYLLDSMEVFRSRPMRIDDMLRHIQNSFWGLPLEPFYTIISGYFNRNTQFGMDMPDHPWIREEAQRRMGIAKSYIETLMQKKRPVRK